MRDGHPTAQESRRLTDRAAAAIGGGEDLGSVDPIDLASALVRALANPGLVLRETASLAKEQLSIAAGRSDVAPERGDARFSDPAWSEHPVYHRLKQGYLAWARSVQHVVEEADLDWRTAERARFASTILTTALAPTNFLVTNPAAQKRALETGGVSLLRGTRNWARDLRENGGMPAQVDRRPFHVGENMAATPGRVVHQTEMFELIQYAPVTEKVHARPVLMVPPQINKFYVLDLAPGRSFVEHVVGQGLQTFAVAWRNPRPEHASWKLDDYIESCLECVEAVSEISKSEDVNLFGLCAGGMTSALMIAWMARHGDARVHSATFAVTIFDFSVPSLIGMFNSREIIERAKRRSQKKGVFDGRDLAKVFLWLRPNDLVWNYWVNNYLMGNDPPAFDILAWNADPANVTAALHSDFLDIYSKNLLAEPAAGLTALGEPIDLADITCDNYIVGGITDHLVPWHACYRGTQIVGGNTTFVLANSGHIQSIINAPGDPKMKLWKDGPEGADPEEWLAGATQHHPATWWEDWAAWVRERSGPERVAPKSPGSRKHKPAAPAPGTYVYETC